MVSTSCELMRPEYGEKVYTDDVCHCVSCPVSQGAMRGMPAGPSCGMTHMVRRQSWVSSDTQQHPDLLVPVRGGSAREE